MRTASNPTCIDCGQEKDLDSELRCDDCYDIEWQRRQRTIVPDKGFPKVFDFTLFSFQREDERFVIHFCTIAGPERGRSLLFIHKDGDWIDWRALWWSTFE